MQPDLDARIDRVRQRVSDQRRDLQEARQRAKAIRAAASAAGDKARAVTMAADGALSEPVPPVPTHVPEDL